jgi:Spy/CpxP family protein refolding chaperone
MKKKIITGLVILSIASASIMAFGPQKDFKKGFRPQNHIAKIMKKLDLNDEQKDALKELRAEQRGERRAFKEHMRENMDIGSMFSKDSFNKSAFIQKATKNFQTQITAKADFIEKAYAILDAVQKENFIQEIGNLPPILTTKT